MWVKSLGNGSVRILGRAIRVLVWLDLHRLSGLGITHGRLLEVGI